MLAILQNNAVMRRVSVVGNAYRNGLIGQRESGKAFLDQMKVRKLGLGPLEWLKTKQPSAGVKCGPKKQRSPAQLKMLKLQKQFQKDDGKPIFLKGGIMDQVLYRLTWLLCFVGLAGNIGVYLHYII